VSLATLSANIIALGTAICAIRDPTGRPDWHEHRPAPVDGNGRVLALASIMNQRRLIRNCGKVIILQEGGSAQFARLKLASLYEGNEDPIMERIILTAKPLVGFLEDDVSEKTCCVLQ